MASIKIVLRTKEKKDGTYPLAIRITKDRRSSFIHLGKHIKKEHWDAIAQRVDKRHPNSVRLNNYLIKKLAEANDHSLDLETQKTMCHLGLLNKGLSQMLKAPFQPKHSFT